MTQSEQKEPMKEAPDSLLSLIKPVVDHRLSIVKFTLIVTILLGLGSLLVRNKYTATAVLLPDIDILSAAQKLGSLQDIASSVGFNLGVTSPSQLYSDMLLSETVLRPVILRMYASEAFKDPVNLIKYWGYDSDDSLKNYERCLKRMREKVVDIDVNKKTGILTLAVETTEPALSSDITNAMIQQLDLYQRNFRRTNASDQRKFLDQRMGEIQADLTKSENDLKDFREKNRRISDSPQLTLEESQLERAVDMNTAVFVELRKQYELVKLDEIKNTPVVQVLDYARTTAEKSGPKRLWIAVLSALFSGLLSSIWFIYVDSFRRSIVGTRDEKVASEVVYSLREDARRLKKLFRKK
jgi:uncharacterized protein involved in exopolysaccharide biosynthesis